VKSTKKRLYPVGRYFCKKAGLTEVLVVHLAPELHERIRRSAEQEERSLQVTARRILEKYFEVKQKQ
jgi:hypothetical protein